MSTLFGKQKKRKRDVSSQDNVPTKNEGQSKAAGKVTVTSSSVKTSNPLEMLGLHPTILTTIRSLGYKKPTPVQSKVIPLLLDRLYGGILGNPTKASGDHNTSNMLVLSATGSGKTASFCLPMIQNLMDDPYGNYALILTPTRELAIQIKQQISVFTTNLLNGEQSVCLITGGTGCDYTRQCVDLDTRKGYFIVATPGRIGELLRGGNCRNCLRSLRYLVLDEADRLLTPNSGFERDVATLLTETTPNQCQKLLFSATMTSSLEEILTLNVAKSYVRIDVRDDAEKGKSVLPAGLKQQYIFMPNQVRDAYLVTSIRVLLKNGGRSLDADDEGGDHLSDSEDDESIGKARSCIIFVSTCERAARVQAMLTELGIDSIALHSILSQDRRRAALGKFQSSMARILVATDVASRGLDIPTVDLVVNGNLPRKTSDYVHRVGRTARAGRRGLAVSLVGEDEVALVHAIEKTTGRMLEKCDAVTDDDALKMLNTVTKAMKLSKMKLAEIGFDELVKRHIDRKAKDRKERMKAERQAKKAALRIAKSKQAS